MAGKTRLIGMLHAPVNTIVAAPPAWREALALPAATGCDWRTIEALDLLGGAEDFGPGAPAALEQVERLSFFSFLCGRMLEEAAIYHRHGVNEWLLENVAAPYFVRGRQPALIYWIMRALAARLRATHPTAVIGLQVLAYSDDWAMDIACRCRLDFVRSESALFEGVRPEGRTPNAGNLALLYRMRNLLTARLNQDGPGPQVYVDLQKKHTLFSPGLDSLDVWLDNLLFQKLEGIIITGAATGCPAAETDLARAREAIEEVRQHAMTAVGRGWAPQLIVGSGVSAQNLKVCKRFADAVIVGSSLKKNGYWECAVEEHAVQRLTEAWDAC